ncbi:hypothetical protein CsSME_00045618 [Camellia sinensis var. sinensis]
MMMLHSHEARKEICILMKSATCVDEVLGKDDEKGREGRKEEVG